MSRCGAAPESRWTWALLAALTLVAALLRFPFLSTQSFWVDEVFTRWVVDHHSLVAMWDQIRRTESTPPLYYLLAKLSTELTGNTGPFALRLPAALALTLAVPVSYMAVRRLMAQAPALATAAFVAVNPTLVNYATDARSYGLLVLTGLLSVWALTEVLYNPAPRRYVWWALASAAALWTQYFAIFTILGELFILAVMVPGQRRRTLAAAVGVAILAGAVAPLAIDQAGSGLSAFIATMPLTHRLEDTVRQFGMGSNVPWAWLEGLGLLLVYFALLYGLWLGRASPGTRVLALLLITTVGLPLLCAVLHIEDRFYMRNVMMSIPLLGALAAPGFMRHRGALMAAVAVVSATVSVWVAVDWRYGQADWRGAIADVSATQRSGPVIVVAPGEFPGPPAGIYLGRTRTSRPLKTTHLLLVVAPGRPAHFRALTAVPPPASVTASLEGFTAGPAQKDRGFQLIELTSATPVQLRPGHVGAAVLFAAGR